MIVACYDNRRRARRTCPALRPQGGSSMLLSPAAAASSLCACSFPATQAPHLRPGRGAEASDGAAPLSRRTMLRAAIAGGVLAGLGGRGAAFAQSALSPD